MDKPHADIRAHLDQCPDCRAYAIAQVQAAGGRAAQALRTPAERAAWAKAAAAKRWGKQP